MAWENFDNIKGPKGDKGPAGTISSVSAETVEAGAPARAEITGTEDVHLHLELPRGPKGDKGPPGVASSASTESLSYGEPAEVILEQHGESVHAKFRIPRGAPGVNAIPAAEAVGSYLSDATSPSRSGFESGLVQVVEDDTTEFSRFLAASIGGAVDAGVSDKVSAGELEIALEDRATVSELTTGLLPKLDRDALPSSLPTAQIRHVEAQGYSYEVIRVKGGRDAIRKIEPKAVSASGTVPLAGLLTPKQMSTESGYMSLVNSDACGGGSTQRINGLHIIDGVAKQDFGVQNGPLVGSGIEALLLMRDGTLRAARARHGKTAAQYVAEGAYSSFGYGPICVENGLLRDIMKPEFSGFTTELSARTILGQTMSGDFVIITVDGKSGSSGITGNTMGNLAVSEGCVIAVVLDGGGTTQTMWRGDVVHPSSDAAGQRTAMSYIAIAAPAANDYDSGPIPLPVKPGVTGLGGNHPLQVRQRGASVQMEFAAAMTIGTDVWVEVSDGAVPARYLAVNEASNRGMVYGTSGLPIGVSVASGSNVVNVRSRTPGQTSTGVEGTLKYQAKFA